MVSERVYQAVLVHLEQDLEGFVGAAFVELSSGRLLTAHSIEPWFDQPALAVAGCASLRANQTVRSPSGGAQVVEEVVVLSHDQIHLYELITPTVFLSVSALRNETNIALVKAAARQCLERLQAADEARARPAAVLDTA